MRVRLLFFGVLREAFGGSEESVALAEGACVAELLRVLRERTSNDAVDGAMWQRLAVAVNREYSTGDRVLCAEDEVALLPPVSGGGR